MNAPARQQTASPAQVEPRDVIIQLLRRYEPVVAKLLATTGMSEQTFMAQIANALRASPDLWKCDPETVLGAALRSAQLNLPPNDGNNLAWIVPYGRTANWQLGYGGVLELARRANPGIVFDGHAVYPGDLFELDLGKAEPLTYVPAFARRDSAGRRRGRTSREAYAWWVRARYPDGRIHVHALDREQVEYHRSFSRQPDGQMWTKSYDAAALKSVVLDMKRWLPLTPQLALAQAADGTVVDVRDLDPDQPELPAGEPIEETEP